MVLWNESIKNEGGFVMKTSVPVTIVIKMFLSNGAGEDAIQKQVTASFSCPDLFFGEREILLSLKPAVEKSDVATLLEMSRKIEGIGCAYPSHDWGQHDCHVALLRDGFDLLLGT
jgi:hypothetical protein